jgi:hypothetical protein
VLVEWAYQVGRIASREASNERLKEGSTAAANVIFKVLSTNIKSFWEDKNRGAVKSNQ